VSSAGVKKSVTKFVAYSFRCGDCGLVFLPKKYLAIVSRYGATLRKWVVYNTIALRQTNENAVDSLTDLFGYSLSPGMMSVFRQEAAEYYRKTYDSLLKGLVNGVLIHADETKVNIKGRSTTGYVWVFANMGTVVYVYSPTREGDSVRRSLKGFRGVLVSDFYTVYDSLNCPQQKCLIHLARDFNDDLLKQPFDEELKQLGRAFTELLQTIVSTIDRYGLSRLHLSKHNKDVSRFYAHVFGQQYRSELAQYYQKRIDKYQEKLFTFLDHDGVPWNNNNAENAVKRFVSRRKIMGTAFTEDGIQDYLVLLSIYQTLRYRGVSLLPFLLSGERNLERFLLKA
jgi:hypothetical protein